MIDPPAKRSGDAEETLRALGYDPTQLTPMEREELAEILEWDTTPSPATAATAAP